MMRTRLDGLLITWVILAACGGSTSQEVTSQEGTFEAGARLENVAGEGPLGVPSVDTGLPGDLLLSEATPAQLAAACRAFSDTLEENYDSAQGVRLGCQAFAAALGNDAVGCRDLTDTCISQVRSGTSTLLTAEMFEVEAPACDGNLESFSACEQTVGAFETCLQDRLVEFLGLVDALVCPRAADVSLADAGELAGYWDSEGPESCRDFEQACPDVIDF